MGPLTLTLTNPPVAFVLLKQTKKQQHQMLWQRKWKFRTSNSRVELSKRYQLWPIRSSFSFTHALTMAGNMMTWVHRKKTPVFIGCSKCLQRFLAVCKESTAACLGGTIAQTAFLGSGLHFWLGSSHAVQSKDDFHNLVLITGKVGRGTAYLTGMWQRTLSK